MEKIRFQLEIGPMCMYRTVYAWVMYSSVIDGKFLVLKKEPGSCTKVPVFNSLVFFNSNALLKAIHHLASEHKVADGLQFKVLLFNTLIIRVHY